MASLSNFKNVSNTKGLVVSKPKRRLVSTAIAQLGTSSSSSVTITPPAGCYTVLVLGSEGSTNITIRSDGITIYTGNPQFFGRGSSNGHIGIARNKAFFQSNINGTLQLLRNGVAGTHIVYAHMFYYEWYK